MKTSFVQNLFFRGILDAEISLYNVPGGFDMVALDLRFIDEAGVVLEPKPSVRQPDPFGGLQVMVVGLTNAIIPDRAHSIRICPVSADGLVGDLPGMCKTFSMENLDLGNPRHMPRKLSIVRTDDDTKIRKMHVRLSFRAAESESDLSYYRVGLESRNPSRGICRTIGYDDKIAFCEFLNHLLSDHVTVYSSNC